MKPFEIWPGIDYGYSPKRVRLPLPVRLALCIPWCCLLAVLALVAGIDEAINWVEDRFRR
jgi:hypothetical protein